MSVVQMNTRIDQSLKEAGDAVFAAIGWSPSQAVRKAWEFAVRHRGNPDVVKEALEDPNPQLSEEAQRKLAIAREGREAMEKCMASLYEEHQNAGPDFWSQNKPYVESEFEALKEQALLERLIEKGLDK